jgi:hypothetical protein
VVLHKARSEKECANFRMIALICHASKVLLTIILDRLRLKVERELPEEQAGFGRGRGTMDMLCCLQVIVVKTFSMNLDAFLLFIDYSKAFDSISQVQLFDILIKMGFPKHLVAMIQNLYINQTATVRWEGEHSTPFQLLKGVTQGCILSPHLFNIYTEAVMREAEIESMGINIGGRDVSNLRYADDATLCSDTQEKMEQITRKVNEAGKNRLLKFNVKKTKLMVVGKGITTTKFVIDNEEVEEVEGFKYLGSHKTTDGDCTKDIKIRIAMAKKKMLDLTHVWNDRGIRKGVKIKLLKTLIWTVMTYGAEGWTVKKADDQRIEAAEMWFYRRMLRISWKEKRTNQSIMEELGIGRELLGRVVKRKLTYFGHICRKQGEDLVKTVIQGKMQGKRGQGRPRISYEDNIKKWTGKPMEVVIRATEDREKRRELVGCAVEAVKRHT